MSSGSRPSCPVEGCDGDLYREFVTGLNRSTAQLMVLAAVVLIVGPLVVGAPWFLQTVMRGTVGVGSILVALLAFLVPAAAGVALLRHRAQRLGQRTEQQRCNRCGQIVPLGGA